MVEKKLFHSYMTTAWSAAVPVQIWMFRCHFVTGESLSFRNMSRGCLNWDLLTTNCAALIRTHDQVFVWYHTLIPQPVHFNQCMSFCVYRAFERKAAAVKMLWLSSEAFMKRVTYCIILMGHLRISLKDLLLEIHLRHIFFTLCISQFWICLH